VNPPWAKARGFLFLVGCSPRTEMVRGNPVPTHNGGSIAGVKN